MLSCSRSQLLQNMFSEGRFFLILLAAMVGSRLSFPATEPQDPRRISEGFQKGSLKGSLKGFRRVLEGF